MFELSRPIKPWHLSRSTPTSHHAGSSESDGAATLGRDGMTYPRRRKSLDVLCSMCGDRHPVGITQCPWDQYAQGMGARPDTEEAGDEGADDSPLRRPSNSAKGGENQGGISPDRNEFHPRPRTQEGAASDVALQVIERLQAVADQAAVLPDLFTDLERAIESDAIVAQSDLLSLRLRRLDDAFGVGMESWCSIVQRLRLVIEALD